MPRSVERPISKTVELKLCMLLKTFILFLLPAVALCSSAQSQYTDGLQRRSTKCPSKNLSVQAPATQAEQSAPNSSDTAQTTADNTTDDTSASTSDPSTADTSTQNSASSATDSSTKSASDNAPVAAIVPAQKSLAKVVQAPTENAIKPIVVPVISTPTYYTSIQDCLAAHNAARSAKGIAPLVWDTKVAANAQVWAQTMHDANKMYHSGTSLYGENIAMGSKTCAEATAGWLSEEAKFVQYGASGVESHWQEYGHYSQCLWKDTQRLGCGAVGEFVSCNYDPPGNYVGAKVY